MLKSKWGWRVIRWIKILVGLYLALLIVIFLVQRRLLYHPDKFSQDESVKIAENHGFLPWQNPSGQIIGWKQLSSTNHPHEQILIVHGNAGCALHRMDYADGLQAAGTFDIYILEFPGYGARPGAPTEESLYQSADEAIGLLNKQGPISLIGESLGTGIAAYLAGAFPHDIRSLLLIAPYNNMTDVAQYHMPIFPVKWMLWDKFPSATHLQNYHGRLGVLLGGRDDVVPSRFGRKLYEDYNGPKKLWEAPRAGHNELQAQSPDWWKEVVTFWMAKP
ncbi:MAG: hypothetical protein JWQ71_3600 [Pedosphaera sp.]|nr:hypothetical protein [Pedosphaera sp.]